MAINFKRLENITSSLKPNNQTGKSFHTTFVYLGNKLIKIGQNNYHKLHKSHIYGRYEPLKDDKAVYVAGIHSEIDSLIRLGSQDCFDFTFVNIRMNNLDQPAISKPCGNCMKVLRQVGYKNIWYFDGEKYVREKYN